MSKANLTPTRLRTFDFIASYIAEHRYAPSLTEICEATGKKSLASAHKHVTLLEECGLLRREGFNRSRGIRLTATGQFFAKDKRQPVSCVDVAKILFQSKGIELTDEDAQTAGQIIEHCLSGAS